MEPKSSNTLDIQIHYTGHSWCWEVVDLITGKVVDPGVGAYLNHAEAEAEAVKKYPDLVVTRFFVSEGGPMWNRYQDD